MIRFYNGRLLDINSNASISSDEVWTDGDRISYVGPKRADAPSFSREIDLKGDLILPGFKNAHTHSAMVSLRSFADDMLLNNWLFDKVFPIEERMTPEHIYAFTRLAILEYLAGGTTCVFDMYMHIEGFAAAVLDSGFRAVICGAASNIETQAEDFIKYNALDPKLSYRLGFHAEYTAKPETMEALATLARSLHAPVSVHSSETKNEVDGCRERYGKTPTELFCDLGLFDFGGTAFHCVHVSPNDMKLMKEHGVWVVTCPSSNAKLASGIAPLIELQNNGVPLALGTDGAASNNALSMFREMYLCCVLQKLRSADAAAMPAEPVLSAALFEGALAMGLSDCVGIEVGRCADLCVIDLCKPNMRPLHNIANNLVYSGGTENVRLTMVAGKILYENGEYFIGDSPETIIAAAERAVKEII